MSESASCISFYNCKATAWNPSSPPGVCLTIPVPLPFPFPFPFPSSVAFPFPFPFPFPFSVALPFPFPYCVAFTFQVPFAPRCISSSRSLSSFWLPSPRWLLPPLGAPRSAQFSSLSSSAIISSQLSGLMARKLPGLYCRQLCGSIFALRSAQQYQEKRSPCIRPPTSWLAADQRYQLDPWIQGGCPTYNWSFGRGFCQTFAPYMSGRPPTTPAEVNSCSWSPATSAGMVKTGELWLDHERFYHWRGPMPSHPWCRKHCMSVWLNGGVPRWILWFGSDPMTDVDLYLISAFLP